MPPPPAELPTLYLVPGHLGDVGDLGARAVEVLRRVRHLFVAEDRVGAARGILRRLGVDEGDVHVVAIPRDRVLVRPVIATLRRIVKRGEDMALFGADGGAPGFDAPAKELLAEAGRLRGHVSIRTLAGPSSLSTALMRLEFHVGPFAYLGELRRRPDVAALARQMRGLDRLPVVFHADGRACRELLPDLIRTARNTVGSVTLLSGLTTDHELVVRAGRADFTPPGPEELPDDTPTVVVLGSSSVLAPPRTLGRVWNTVRRRRGR